MTAVNDDVPIYAGALELRPGALLALAHGTPLYLTRHEFGLVVALARRIGRVVPREELYEAVWGGPLRADDRSVDVYVKRLRRKLAEAVPDGSFIHTPHGFGYRFDPERSPNRHGQVTSRLHRAGASLGGSAPEITRDEART